MCLVFGFILDLIFGDPVYFIPHPVVLIGKMISFLERQLRKLFPNNIKGEFIAGVLVTLLVCFISFFVPLFIIILLSKISVTFSILINIYFCYKMIAVKSLKDESMKVYYELEKNNLESARTKLSYIVGRDTKNLDEKHIINAAVETVAENTSDGVVAPLFYMMIGGAPLICLYKAVNTLDSMIGYKNDKYKYFGKFAARTDDLFNFIPSRLAAVFMLFASLLLKLDFKNGVIIFLRDRKKHASPNSAQTEAVCAGVLGIRLAGDTYYFGKLYKKPYIGDALRECSKDDILTVNKLLYLTSFLVMLFFSIINISFNVLFFDNFF